MIYPNKCCQCGFCCLTVICLIAQKFYKIKEDEPCPALLWKDNKAYCELIPIFSEKILGIGAGCCIKARAFKDGISYDFASLPEGIKIYIAKRRCNAVLSSQHY